MDRRRIELQLRVIIVTYRIERRRRDSPTMEEFRKRAHSLLRSLEEQVQPHPDLEIALAAVRREIDGNLIAFDISNTVEERGVVESHPRSGHRES